MESFRPSPRIASRGKFSGFTLIELLIVVAIIAILAAIAVPNFLEAQIRAKVSRVKADLRTFATAMESYTVDNNRPSPTFNGSFNPPPSWGIAGPIVEGRQDRWHWLTSPISYITSPMKDPFVVTSTTGDPNQQIMIIWSDPLWPSGTLPGSTSGVNYAPILYKEQTFSSFSQESKGFWVAFSFGPDRDPDVNDTERAMNGIQDYDPTNGSISDGDVTRARGQ